MVETSNIMYTVRVYVHTRKSTSQLMKTNKKINFAKVKNYSDVNLIRKDRMHDTKWKTSQSQLSMHLKLYWTTALQNF